MEQCHSWCYNVVPMLHWWTNPRWPNVICWCCANVSYDVGPTSVQHFSASWEGVGRPLVPWLAISSRCFHPKQLAGHTAMVSTRRKFLPNLEALWPLLYMRLPLTWNKCHSSPIIMLLQALCIISSWAISEIKLSNQSGNAQFGSKLMILTIDGCPWKKYRALLLCCIKLCASFYNHQWNQNGVTVQKRPIQVKIDDCLTDDLEKQ